MERKEEKRKEKKKKKWTGSLEDHLGGAWRTNSQRLVNWGFKPEPNLGGVSWAV